MQATYSLFTADETQATNALAAIALDKLAVTAVSWREHRRQNATNTVILVLDSAGHYYCYAGDALRVARHTDFAIPVHTSIFGGKKVDTLAIAAKDVPKVLKALHNNSLNAMFIA